MLRRTETLHFISCDMRALTEITRWFTSHTGFNVFRSSAASKNLLRPPNQVHKPGKSHRQNETDAAENTLADHIIVELNSEPNLAKGLNPNLENCRRVSVSVGHGWAPDVKGFAVLSAIRDKLGLPPQVSVIVPNYNHGAYLRKRLHSIYAQSFKDFEVILLDDASNDDSKTVLESYARTFPSITRQAYNLNNSGNVFAQWEKGIGLASAPLVWIAESDDFAEPDLLEVLLPYFQDDNIRLAYCYPMFVNGAGKQQPLETEHYFRRASSNKWNSSYIETSHNEVNQVLGSINTIPNVSSVVFRKPNDSTFIRQAATYQLCGDWYFYLELIRGWKIAFTNETRSYFRFQDTGVTGTTLKSPKYVEEHLALAKTLAQKYRISPNVLRRFFEQLQSVVKTTGLSESFQGLDGEFELNRVCSQNRYLNILLVTQGFFLGGGEILPVHLANELRRQGHNVIIASLEVLPENIQIRSAVSPDIPVYKVDDRKFSESAFRDFIRNNGIDVVNSHGHGSDLFVLKYIGKETIPWLVTMHGGYEFLLSDNNANERPDEYRHVKRCLEAQLQRVDRWIYIADKNLQPFLGNPRRDRHRFIKIPNGLGKRARRTMSRKQLGIPEDAFVMCCATRAIPEKGWHVAVELRERVALRVNREVHLILLGEGPVFDELCSRTLDPNVHLLGFKDEVVNYFALSELGILCSSYSGESFPLCIIECLFAGRPLLVTDIGECRDMLSVEGESMAGAVFSLDHGKITDAILLQMENWLVDIIQDDGRYARMCRSAKNVAERFSIETVATQYVDSYRQAIEARPVSECGVG